MWNESLLKKIIIISTYNKQNPCGELDKILWRYERAVVTFQFNRIY